MNIGIVTIYDGNNMGSFLQAVALKMSLEDMGHTVAFVERMTEEENFKLFINRPFSKHRRFPLNIIASVKRSIFNAKDDNQRRQEIRKIYKILSEERKNLPVVKPDNIKEYDLLICGSDEIWNFRNTSISVPFYTCLSYGDDIKKIAYAVSIGISNQDDFKKQRKIVEAISKFDYIYPRDNHTKETLHNLYQKNYEIVCDPTLLVNRERLISNNERLIQNSYILVYAYDLNDSEEQLLKRFSKDVGLPIVSVLHYLRIADSIVTESPYDFGNLILNASYCYTSTFHGTIFCTLFAKKFLYHDRRPKVKEVAEYMGITDRLWSQGKYEQFKERMKENVDRDRIDAKLKSIREENVEKLKSTIATIEKQK